MEWIHGVRFFVFKGDEKTFSHSIVQTTTGSAHAGDKAFVGKGIEPRSWKYLTRCPVPWNRKASNTVLHVTAVMCFTETSHRLITYPPLNLGEADETYQQAIDVLWDFQPTSAEVSNYKRACHP
ncbi:MAG: hypothetical protein LBV45_07070, partial [Xanthomonadaceae bacterium]|nr:hypothetical protein [Xanthomonadaceae bacterium]